MKVKPGFDALMHEVCVGMGWCGGIVDDKPCHVRDFIPDEGTVSADQFVDWLFRADNLDPYAKLEIWQPHKDMLRAAFVKHMGSDVVDARALRYDLD